MHRSGPILVVDDDAVSRHVLLQALDQAGLEGHAVGSGALALSEIAREPPSLVLLDLIMPPPDGYDVLRHLRGHDATREIPVVVLTAVESDEEVARAFAEGADDFLRKPFRPAELVARIRAQLRLRESAQALLRKEEDAKFVLELTQALASTLDPHEILFTVVRRTAEVAHVDRCSLVLVLEGESVGYVVAASDDERMRDHPVELDKYPEIRKVLASGEPLIVADAQQNPLLEVVRSDVSAGGFVSLALLPVVFEGRAMGVLFLRARYPVAFGPYEMSVYRTIANTTAIALRNARILQSLRDETREIRHARHEAERRARVLQRFADFFESAADGIVVIDRAGHVLFANPRAQEITGYGEEDLRGRRVADLVAAADRPHADAIEQGFRGGAYPRAVDFRLTRKDGRAIVLSVSFGSVQHETDAVLLTFRDVTQERAMEAELVATKEFLERVIDASVDAIVSADARGRVLLFNRAAERCYGYAADEVIGRVNVEEMYPPGVAREVMRCIRSRDFGGPGRLGDYRCEVLARSGERIPVALSAALLVENGTPVGTVGIFTDLRERLRMEQRLLAAQHELQAREKQALIAELAGAAAHELNQPLTSVLGYAELLRRRLEAGRPEHSAVEVLVSETERMAEIVRKIGKITRYETKSYVGTQKILDLDRASEAREPRSGPPSEPGEGEARTASEPPHGRAP